MVFEKFGRRERQGTRREEQGIGRVDATERKFEYRPIEEDKKNRGWKIGRTK
jgi:hypothetical protein